MIRQVICSLDTNDLAEAALAVKRLSPHVCCFKIGYGLVLPHGLDAASRLRDHGAERILLDLKLSDYPDAVAAVVRETARREIWGLTLHISGGAAMMQAAVEEADQAPMDHRPFLLGLALLGSIDQRTLTEDLGVTRSVEDHVAALARQAIDNDLDAVGCAAEHVARLREEIGHATIICRGGRDRPACASTGANYVVLGRALLDSDDPEATLRGFGFVGAPTPA